ncbi:MAG: hypothetical protein WCL51_07195 [Bacteroidota bacterium]
MNKSLCIKRAAALTKTAALILTSSTISISSTSGTFIDLKVGSA